MTVNRGRMFDLLIGCVLGILVTGASSMYTVGQRVASLEIQVQGLRRDVDRLTDSK